MKKKRINIKKNLYLKNELLIPTKIYVREVIKLLKKNLINGCANITGGGLKDNLSRVLPENLDAELNLNKIKITKIFKFFYINIHYLPFIISQAIDILSCFSSPSKWA